MALINKFFPVKEWRPSSKSDSCLLDTSKRQSSGKQREILSQTLNNQRNSHRLSSSNVDSSRSYRNESARVRLLLFRECEVRGRRLLFDSGGGMTASSGEGGQQQIKDEFQELQLMKDMVFGSATLKYSGDNVRVHDFASSPWKGYELMLSKVFLVPAPAAQQQHARTDKRIGNLSALPGGIDKVASAATADSGYTESTEDGMREGRNSECWSSGSSLAIAATHGPSSASTSRTSFASVSLAVPTVPSSTRNAVSDSLLSSKSADGRPLNFRARKTRLAIALMFSSSSRDQPSNSQEMSVRAMIFEQFSLAEHFIQRLQHNVLRAYFSRTRFPALIQEAIRQFETDLANVLSLTTYPNADVPVYLTLASSPSQSSSQEVAQRFMNSWETVIAETDTKLTHFFWSSLLSAVLTYHVNWLHSFVRQPVNFSDCGTRVLVLSKDSALARRLLHILSYFVRMTLPAVAKTDAKDCEKPSSPTTSPSKNNSMMNPSHSSSHNGMSKSMGRLSCQEGSQPSPSGLSMRRCSNSAECCPAMTPARRSSQQLDNNTRYLRNYYDVRFQLSPDTIIAKRDGTAFANLISYIAKNDFQDFSLHDHYNLNESTQSARSCGFFVGSVPDKNDACHESPVIAAEATPSVSETQPVLIPMPSFNMPTSTKSAHFIRWSYGSELGKEYQAGRALQSCDPSVSDWLHELQLDLRAASARAKSASCVVANTETWEIQVLTCTEEEGSRIKQVWMPVTMSSKVAALVESTQLLWLMMRNAQQCLDHVEDRLRFLCQKSEDLGDLLSSSIGSWNVHRVTSLLDIETGDLPLLMAACSVHSPSVATMGGVTIL